ncbi:MAG: magnesium transporter [Mycoplasmoidaceae bacterium]
MKQDKKEIYSLSKIIQQNYAQKNTRNLKKIIKNKPINILIESIENINDFEVLNFFLFCAIKIRIGEIFISLSYDNKLEVIRKSASKLIKEIFDDLESDDLYEILDNLPKKEFKKTLFIISPNVREEFLKLSRYEEGEVGSIMNSSFVELYSDLTISKAVKIIENNKDDLELNGFIYVIDNNKKLVGQIYIYDILLRKERNIQIKKIMNKAFVSINNHEKIENLLVLFQKYDLKEIPVVNSDNVLLGFIDDSDVISALKEGTTEDIYKMYGINELDTPYSRTRVIDIFKSRILWLILLMIASTFTSIALEQLQGLSESWTGGAFSTLILVPIIPVISGTSGNAGSQTAASIIRSLSIGDIGIKEYKKIIYKEFLVALAIGTTLATVNFLRLMIYYQIFPIDLSSNPEIKWSSLEFSAIISCGISFALLLAILLSKFVGSILPILAVKVNIDPASMASPLLTTIIDTITISILFLLGSGIIYALIK